jgi:putative phosphoesterase
MPVNDYRQLDRPDVLAAVFHPRPSFRHGQAAEAVIPIPVAPGVVIGSRFHITSTASPSILFFHGNGEIVSDYDDLGPLYNDIGINFIVADYRGYGDSTGRPTVSHMMTDCHAIFDFTTRKLAEDAITGPLFIMGRSLGSASALELAVTCPDRIGGLIIESGFAHIAPLLELLGVDAAGLGLGAEGPFRASGENREDRGADPHHSRRKRSHHPADGRAGALPCQRCRRKIASRGSRRKPQRPSHARFFRIFRRHYPTCDSRTMTDNAIRDSLQRSPRGSTIAVGVISDTHGELPEWVLQHFAGCRIILHAGDIGGAKILEALGAIAPVVAVRGNMDRGEWASALPPFEMLEIGASTTCLVHDIGSMDLDPSAAGVHIVIYGHTHRPLAEKRNGILFLNPGSAGWPRHGYCASVAILYIDGTTCRYAYYEE